MLNVIFNYPFDSSLGIQEALRFQGHKSKSSSKFLEKVEGTNGSNDFNEISSEVH